jgi:CIC family chloride channel protein
VFAPSLFVGAMLGAVYGIVAQHLLPGVAGATGAYAVIGMGAVFAGAARAPLTAVVILSELTGEYSIILPLMLAVVLATAVSRLLSKDTIYTLKLRRRGIDLDAPAPGARIGEQLVGAVMEPLPAPLATGLPLTEAADLLAASGHGALPVLDDEGRYAGMLTAQAVAEALSEPPDGAPTRVGDVVEVHEPVTADESLAAALRTLVEVPGTGLPVLDRGTGAPVGWLSHRVALRALHGPHLSAVREVRQAA